MEVMSQDPCWFWYT